MTEKQCSEGGCEKKVIARDLCPMHYARWSKPYRDAGLPLPPKPPRPVKERLPCTIEGCDNPADSLGLCDKHYTRLRRNGDPLIVQYIRGDDRARFESHVDRSGGLDACHPWTGSQCAGGYGQIKMNGRLELVHIVAWEFEHGKKSPGTDIDHECHNRAVREGTCHPGICAHRLCCNEAHLVAKTRQEHRDDTTQWAMPRGSIHPKATLDEAQVQEIRRLLDARITTQKRIAAAYGVSQYVVTKIKHGKSWAWLPLPDDL